MVLVTVRLFIFWTPRIIMHSCLRAGAPTHTHTHSPVISAPLGQVSAFSKPRPYPEALGLHVLMNVCVLTQLQSPRQRLWAAGPLIFPALSAWSGAPGLGDTNKAQGSGSDSGQRPAGAGLLRALTLEPPAVDLHDPAENSRGRCHSTDCNRAVIEL